MVRLVRLLYLLGQDWVFRKRQYDRRRLSMRPSTAEDEKDEAVWEAYQDHPFLPWVELAHGHSGIDQDLIREAAIKNFNGAREVVVALNELDASGVTAELFEKLHSECPDIAERLFPGEGPTGTTQKAESKPRGRRKADYETVQYEADLVDDWKQAHETGVCKVEFAKQEGLKVKDFDALLARVRMRNSSAKE